MWLPVRLPSWAIPFLTLQNRTELPPIFCLAVLGPSGGLPSSAMPLLTLKNKTELPPIFFWAVTQFGSKINPLVRQNCHDSCRDAFLASNVTSIDWMKERFFIFDKILTKFGSKLNPPPHQKLNKWLAKVLRKCIRSPPRGHQARTPRYFSEVDFAR